MVSSQHGQHLVDWFESCRRTLPELRRVIQSGTVEEAVDEIGRQYQFLAKLRKINDGSAVFVGVPGHRFNR